MKKYHLLKPQYWLLWIGLGLSRFLVLLPYTWLMYIGSAIGWLAHLFSRRAKHVTKTNLQLCFPHLTGAERKQLSKDNFRSLGQSIIEILYAMWATDSQLRNLYTIHNSHYITDAQQKGQSIIFLGAHFHTIYIAGRLFTLNYQTSIMYRELKNPVLEYIYLRFLKKSYKKVITRHDLRGLIRCLKNKEPIWYTPDVDPGHLHQNKLFVPFFGIPAATATAILRFAEVTDVAVIPVHYVRRKQCLGYDIYFDKAIENFPSKDDYTDIRKVNAIVEKQVKLNPEQYLWQYKRFKTREQKEAIDFYTH